MGPDEHGGDTESHPGVRLDFSINVNPLGVPPEVRYAIIYGLDSVTAYPDPQCRELRAALARYHGIGMGNITCGNGASDLIHRVISAYHHGLYPQIPTNHAPLVAMDTISANTQQTFISLPQHPASDRPLRILIPTPTFTEYERAARIHGADVCHHRLNPCFFNLTDAVLDEVTEDTDMVFCCQPNNPTGRLIDPALTARLIERTRERGTLLVIDECFLPFTDAQSAIDKLESHIVILRAFTKTHGLAGLRLGYAVCGDETLAAAMAEQGPRWNVSSLAQIAGVAALDSESWEENTRALIRREREWLTEALTQLGLSVVPSQANFLLFRHKTDLFSPLLDRGILIRSCANFDGLDESYYRIGIKQHADNVILIDSLREILSLDGHPKRTPPVSDLAIMANDSRLVPNGGHSDS